MSIDFSEDHHAIATSVVVPAYLAEPELWTDLVVTTLLLGFILVDANVGSVPWSTSWSTAYRWELPRPCLKLIIQWMVGGVVRLLDHNGNVVRSGFFIAAGPGFTPEQACNGAVENTARQLVNKILGTLP